MTDFRPLDLARIKRGEQLTLRIIGSVILTVVSGVTISGVLTAFRIW